MKTFQTIFISLLLITLFLGVQNMTVEEVLKAVVNKGWTVFAVLLGEGQPLPSANYRPLPNNQGDDSETIIPIQDLEDAE